MIKTDIPGCGFLNVTVTLMLVHKTLNKQVHILLYKADNDIQFLKICAFTKCIRVLSVVKFIVIGIFFRNSLRNTYVKDAEKYKIYAKKKILFQ